MELKTYFTQMTADERDVFAVNCKTSLGHLRNVMYGYKRCATDLAVHIERESKHQVTRPELRSDWANHWPELAEEAEGLGA